jgi:hypothetical protein
MVFVKPVQRILDEEFAHVLSALAVEVHGGSPGSPMPRREVKRAEQRPVRAIGTKVVVDNVQQDREAKTMGRIDKPTEIIRGAICARGANRLTPSYPSSETRGNPRAASTPRR